MKDSRSSNANVPLIVYHFQDAHEKVFGTKIHVSGEKNIERFRQLEKRLQLEEISVIDYTINCVLMLQDWMKEREFRTVPLTLLTGNWIYNKYKKLKSQKTVRLKHKKDYVDDVEYQDEYTVAVEYIRCKMNGNPTIRYMDVVVKFDNVLSDEWKCSYDSGKLRKYEVRVLNDLECQYDVSAYSLSDMIMKLLKSGNY